MAASLAHEIKQPIAAAITSANSCVEWLAHEPPNLDRARAAAARIDKYGNRAAEIIDRIRSFYRKSPPQRELVDVNGIIQEMLTLLEGEATRYSVAMRTELAAELPKIMADRVQLQQVFMNLMLNAIEAMKDSGGELTVKSQLQDGQLQFSVSDTGVGLPTEKMDQIFSAFFTTKPQGSGMGLAISRSIVESHGGQLWASANNGRAQHFISPYRSRSRSHRLWLPKVFCPEIPILNWKGIKNTKVLCGPCFRLLATPFPPTLAPHLLGQVKFEKNSLANGTRSRPHGYSPSLWLQSVERSGTRL